MREDIQRPKVRGRGVVEEIRAVCVCERERERERESTNRPCRRWIQPSEIKNVAKEAAEDRDTVGKCVHQ
jgi:hypothetical protein